MWNSDSPARNRRTLATTAAATAVVTAAATVAAALTVLALGWAGVTNVARAADPPKAAPGAAPSGARLIGTWTVTEYKGGPADGRSDRSESTTYRFEEGGRVTVAGSKQCAYALNDAELKVDCHGQVAAGKVEFRGETTMVWSIGGNQAVTFLKR
jgi:hypothetical protein